MSAINFLLEQLLGMGLQGHTLGSNLATIDFSGVTTMSLPSGTTIGGSSVAALGVITSNSANSLTVGPSGATNPIFNVDSSTASAVAGLNLVGAATGGTVTLTVTDSGSNASLTIDAKGTGTIKINSVSTTAGLVTLGNATSLAGVKINGATVVQSIANTAFTVGRQGSTNPVFQVDASATTVVTGVKVTGKAAASGAFIAAISSGTNEDLFIDGQAGGNIKLGTVSTGFILLNRQTIVQAATNNAISVGANGSSNPVFQVDSSVGSVATGINIQGQAAGSGVLINAISSGSAENVVIQAVNNTNKITISDTLAAATAPLIIGNATDVITGNVTDAYTGGVRLTPVINSASAHTITRYNYFDVLNVSLGGAGASSITNGALFRFNAAAGTHTAVDASTTKTTPGGVDAWVKVNINGTIYYMPSYLSKTA